jgi:hypothetical protein
MAEPEDIPVSDTDELAIDEGAQKDRTRTLGDFSKTNYPLSEKEIEQRTNIPPKRRPTGDKWNTRTPDDTEEPAWYTQPLTILNVSSSVAGRAYNCLAGTGMSKRPPVPRKCPRASRAGSLGPALGLPPKLTLTILVGRQTHSELIRLVHPLFS